VTTSSRPRSGPPIKARPARTLRAQAAKATGRRPAVVVVDDDRGVCDAVADILTSAGCRPACYTDPVAFLEDGRPGRYDCLILDVRMPGMSGLEVQTALNNLAADLPVVFISGHGDIPMAMSAARAGALQFLEKPFREQALLAAVDEALAVGAARRTSSLRRARLRAKMAELTPRELQVAEAVAAGRSAGDIARRFGLSARTVEMHKLRAMRRLGVSSSTGMTRIVVEAQIAGVMPAPAHGRPRGG